MKNRLKPKSTDRARSNGQGQPRIVRAKLLVLFAVLGLLTFILSRFLLQSSHGPRRNGQITFNHDIAPLLFGHCATCHRPGQSAPFPLLTYADAKKHSRQIIDVTSQGLMPPWLPDGPRDQFVDDRRLSHDELEAVRDWANGGMPEGNSGDLPAIPAFSPDWPLGPPDLVVTLNESYEVPADGPNIYRNFVLPLGLRERRYVRAVDCRPGSAAVHHVLMALDRSNTARRWDARDAGLGFAGFTLPPGLEMPPHFLFWHPGKRAAEVQPGLAWPLEAMTDLVLQIHMRPTGKKETVSPQIAFYFTNTRPTNQPAKVFLSTLKIAIPAGISNHVVRNRFQLAGDADLLAIAPHAHFLAREITGRAKFPDGSERSGQRSRHHRRVGRSCCAHFRRTAQVHGGRR